MSGLLKFGTESQAGLKQMGELFRLIVSLSLDPFSALPLLKFTIGRTCALHSVDMVDFVGQTKLS